jgi:hypothetical protein
MTPRNGIVIGAAQDERQPFARTGGASPPAVETAGATDLEDTVRRQAGKRPLPRHLF